MKFVSFNINGLRARPHQLAALVERVKMNHAPWGRTLVDLESAGRRLEKLQSQYHDEITRLFSILNLDASDRNAESRLKELIQKLSEELTLAADSFGQWRQYRELCESFREIRHAILSLEKQIRNGMTPETIETVATVVPQTAVQTQAWLAQASESAAAYEQTESQPQARIREAIAPPAAGPGETSCDGMRATAEPLRASLAQFRVT